MSRRKSRRLRSSSSNQPLAYEAFEPRMLLACDFSFGANHSGVAVADDASGSGFLMYSSEDVHTRFANIGQDSAEHFVAVRLDRVQWQYNDDIAWVDFEPADSDLLVAELNFDTDKSSTGFGPSLIEGISRYSLEGDLWIAPNRFGGAVDVGEFELLGECTDIDLSTVLPTDAGSRGNLEQLAFGSQAFESVTGEFPNLAIFDDDGNPLLSWRVQILPYLGLESLYNQFHLDEPWNSDHNLSLLDQMPDVFKSSNFASLTKTVFQAVAGEESIFPLVSESIGYDEIGDGSANTVLFVEADANRAVEWTRPKDLTFNEGNPLSGLGQSSEGGFAVVMASGDSHLVPSTIDPVNFANMLKRDDGNVVEFGEFAEVRPVDDALRQITIAALNYEGAFRRLPAHAIYSDTGEPLLSWRVAILPFMEQGNLYDQFHLDEPWDSPHNITLLPLMPHIYAYDGLPNGMTNFLGASGPDSIFNLSDQGIQLGAVFDGLSNTILVVEANTNQAVEWTKPSDLLVDAANPLNGLGEIGDDGFHVGFLDGLATQIPNEVESANLANMLRRGDGGLVDFGDFGREHSLQHNLRLISLAQHNYESAYMRFPYQATYSRFDPNGPPLLSWRVEILPFIEQGNLYDMFNHEEPWDSPHNFALLPLMPDIFATPGVTDGMTVIQAAVGPNTMFTGGKDNIRFENISDDASNTILVMETNPAQAVEWTRPMDIDFDSASPRNGLADDEGVGFFAAMGDGSTRFISQNVTDVEVGFLLERNDGNSFETNHMVETPTLIERNSQVSIQLRQMALAAHNFESSHMHFPGHAIYSERPGQGGEPLLSWRVSILPFIGQEDLYNQFNLDEPWDSPNNLSLVQFMPQLYAHPLTDNGMTVFQVVTSERGSGPTTIFTIGNEEKVRFSSITDGSSNTLLFAEANIDQAVIWTKPDDLMYEQTDPKAGLTEAFMGVGFNVAMADGSAKFISHCIAADDTRRLLLRNDGEAFSGDYRQYCNNGTVVPSDFFGTAGDDNVEVVIGVDTVSLIINGVEQTLDRAVFDQMTFDGLGGSDSITIVEGAGDSVATFSPNSVHIEGDFEFLVENVFDNVVTSGGGNDVAFFIDSVGDDVFRADVDSAKLELFPSGNTNVPDQVLIANGFSIVNFNPTVGNGFDLAILEGSIGDDEFVSTDGLNELSGLGFLISITIPERIEVPALGGNDVATIFDSLEDDSFSVSPVESLVNRGSQSIQAIGFSIVELISEVGGQDDVTLIGSGVVDTLSFSPMTSRLTGGDYEFMATGFAEVTAAGAGGEDVANIIGSIDNDNVDLFAETGDFQLFTFSVTASLSGFELLNVDLDGGEDSVTVNGSAADDDVRLAPGFVSVNGTEANFENTELFSAFGAEGHDIVRFVDSVGDDTLEIGVGTATMQTFSELFTADGFESVFAVSDNGGLDIATLNGSPEAEQLTADAERSVLSGPNLLFDVSFFPFVNVNGGGGNDRADLSNDAGDVMLEASGDFASMVTDVAVVSADGFATIHVETSGGVNEAIYTGTAADEIFSAGPNIARVTSNGFNTTWSGFERVRATGGGGNDEANLSDSTGHDIYTGTGNNGHWNLEGAEINAIAFEMITVTSDNGGEDLAYLNGSHGNDIFNANATASLLSGAGYLQRIGGFMFIAANAESGNDKAYFSDSSGDDTFYASSTFGRMTYADSSARANGFDLYSATSMNGGADEAIMIDSADADQFFANSEFARMTGNNFAINASGFGSVIATANDGNDSAAIIDSAGADNFYARPGFASMTMPGLKVTLVGFRNVSAFSQNGGEDTASLLDTVGPDSLFAGEASAVLVGDGYRASAAGFSRVTAFATGGLNEAHLFGTDQDDRLFLSPQNGYMRGDNFFNATRGFEFIFGYAGDGDDKAILNDSTGDDMFIGTPTSGVLSGDGFRNAAFGFDSVSTFSSGGTDKASLIDSTGNDVFFATPAEAYLRGVGFVNFVGGFAEVSAFASTGFDRVIFHDSAGDDKLNVGLNSILLVGNDFKIQGFGFRTTITYASSGNDTASLTDASGDDELYAGIRGAQIIGSVGSHEAYGFDRVFANSFNGGDDLLYGSSRGYELFFNGNWRRP